jgi:hypothetical protein
MINANGNNMDNDDSIKKIKQVEKGKISIECSKAYEEYNNLLNIEEDERQKIEDEKNTINTKIDDRKNKILKDIDIKSNESQILNDSINDAIDSNNIDQLLSIIKNLP